MNCKNKSFMTKKKAFTLIELLIVIAIIGILFIVLVSKVDFATDKAKATGVQTDFRSFQLAFDTVAKENAGFNTFGWDTGDANQDGKRNSYDEGDINKNGVRDDTEVFTGRKVYDETFTKVFSLKKNGTGDYDRDALNRLEAAINANLDPKLHITIKDDGEIVMANGAQDPWNKEYHGWYITNAEVDKKDRGAIVMYSDGANNEFGSEHTIANGVVSVTVPGSNKFGKDDYSIVSVYTYINGYGEVLNMTTGFSNNQVFGGNVGSAPSISQPGGGEGTGGGTVDDVITPQEPDNTELLEPGLYETGTTNLLTSWDDLLANGTIVVSEGAVSCKDATIAGDLLLPGDNSITRISDSAFEECNNLTSVTIPDSVTSIGGHVFEECSGLTSVIFSENSQLTNISSWAFKKCSSLTSITIPDSVTYICSEAFYYCTGLTSIVIPNSVAWIESEAFRGCSGLTSVEIGDSVTSIGRFAFEGCSSLKSITIPDGVTSISESAFSSCSSLTSVNIPNRVTSIGNYAFSGTSLTSITIPDGVTSIGQGAFYNCRFTSVTIPDGVTSIKANVFMSCTELKSIAIPDGVTSIESGAFSRCTGLTSVTIPNSVTSIGNQAFYNCTGLTSIAIPDSVTSIGQSVFSGCTGLTNITIPDGVTSIEYGVFQYCTGLTSIVIPNSVTSISTYAFSGCTGLTNITIPDSVTSIGDGAFSGCTRLTNITIPDSVTSIGDGAFDGCTSLTSITFNGTMAQWNAITKGYHWKTKVPATKVVCSDGTVSLS